MSQAEQVLGRTLRRLLLVQLVLVALCSALFWLVGSGTLPAAAALYGGAIAVLNSLTSARHLQRAARTSSANRQMAELYIGAVIRFIATPALIAVGIAAFEMPPVPILAGFGVAQIAYFIGNRGPEAREPEQDRTANNGARP